MHSLKIREVKEPKTKIVITLEIASGQPAGLGPEIYEALFSSGLIALLRLVKGVLDKRSLDLDILSVMVDMEGSRPHKGKIHKGSEIKRIFEKRGEAGDE